MSSGNSGDGTWTAPKQVVSITGIENQVSAEIQQLKSDSSGLSSFIPNANAGLEAGLKAASNYVAQDQYNQLLSADLETQAAPGFAGHNYSAYTATQLKQMVTTNMDPTTAGGAASTWTDLGNKYVTVAQDLGQSATNSEYGWQGAAGDSARDFITGIAKWTGSAGQGAQLAGNRLAVQSEAASTVKYSMPTNPTEPPSAADVASTMMQPGFDPIFGAMKLNAQFKQAAADHAVAVQAAQTYDTSLATSGEKFPAFNAPPTFSQGGGSSVPAPSSGGGGVSGMGSAGNVPRAGRSVRGAGSPGASGGSAGSGLRPPPVTSPSGAGTPNSSTGQSGFDPGTTANVPGATNPNVPWPGSGSNLTGNNADPTFSGSLLGELGSGGVGGLASGAGAGAGGLRGLAGGAGQGGARSGVGAGAVDEEGEGGVGVRGGAAGEPGESGMMPRGGRGKGGEDAEHKRPAYLLNPDPDATFGPDEYVAPPVIGE